MKLSFKSFISLLKYVMVIVIVFVIAMIVICLFMPTSKENFKEGVDNELTIDTLTRDIIINMTLDDIYKNVFEPFSNFNVDVFISKGKTLKSKIIELSNIATDPLTEEDIITLITKQMIEVEPSLTQVKIIEVCENAQKYYMENNEIMRQKQNELMDIFQNIFPQQKISPQQGFGVFQILTYKHKPKMNGVYLTNPFTQKSIDQFTGLPTIAVPATPTPTTPTPTPEPTPTPTPTTPTPTPTPTPTTPEPTPTPTSKNINNCSKYDNRKDECNKAFNTNKNKNCHYNDTKNKCRVIQ